MINQKELKLQPFEKGFHLITDLVINNIDRLPESGILNIFIKHTSAGLTINENALQSVRDDLKNSLDYIIKENEPFYTHTTEGLDDMPSHIKTSLIGNSLSIPITNGKLSLGTWQGIYLCEFRNNGGPRKLVLTMYS